MHLLFEKSHLGILYGIAPVLENLLHLSRDDCVACALALRQFLISQNVPGKQISLFTGSTADPFCNIYHEQLQRNISINGRHEAIAIEIDGQELVFDNIHPQGISRIDWSNTLYCPAQDLGGDFQVTETEF